LNCFEKKYTFQILEEISATRSEFSRTVFEALVSEYNANRDLNPYLDVSKKPNAVQKISRKKHSDAEMERSNKTIQELQDAWKLHMRETFGRDTLTIADIDQIDWILNAFESINSWHRMTLMYEIKYFFFYLIVYRKRKPNVSDVLFLFHTIARHLEGKSMVNIEGKPAKNWLAWLASRETADLKEAIQKRIEERNAH